MSTYQIEGFETTLETAAADKRAAHWNGFAVPRATLAEIRDYAERVNAEAPALGLGDVVFWTVETEPVDGGICVTITVSPEDDEPQWIATIADESATIELDGLTWEIVDTDEED